MSPSYFIIIAFVINCSPFACFKFKYWIRLKKIPWFTHPRGWFKALLVLLGLHPRGDVSRFVIAVLLHPFGGCSITNITFTFHEFRYRFITRSSPVRYPLARASIPVAPLVRVGHVFSLA